MAEKILVALFDAAAAAHRAVDELYDAGIGRDRMQVVTGTGEGAPGSGTGEGFNAQTGAGAVAESRGFGVPGTDDAALLELGMPEADARSFAEAVREGATLLVARLEEGQEERRALGVLERDGRVHVPGPGPGQTR